ncbi:MAG: dihydroorotate dehydrogenase, partial [Planctomycetes bacterium]|nr:dihydroorotate dehydrogenase [Planctomycetota bacterium]
MPSLETNYVGLKLRTPIILASAGTTEKAELMKKAEDAGAGAVVMKSLFEQEVTRVAPTPRFRVLHHNLGNLKTFTLYSYEQASIWGPERYAEEVTRAKKTVGIPVIASINCITDEGWASYARRMEQAGADALELNTSCPHGSITFRGHEVHETILKVVEIVRREVRIPIITKLSPQLTIPLAMTKEVEKLGSNGVVI